MVGVTDGVAIVAILLGTGANGEKFTLTDATNDPGTGKLDYWVLYAWIGDERDEDEGILYAGCSVDRLVAFWVFPLPC